MASQIDMQGKVVIVTGGSRGVGRGITTCYLNAGAEVVTCGRNEPDEPVSAGDRAAHFVKANVRDPEGLSAIFDKALEIGGRLDVLVNNAGGTPPGDSATASPRFQSAIVDLNLVAPLNAAAAAFQIMERQPEGGSIIFISSVVANDPGPSTPAYCAAKAGIDALSISLAKRFAPRVRVNTVTPGLIATEQSELFYGEDEGASIVREIPMQRMGRPEDIGKACLLLSDPELAGWITGSNLGCHGGLQRPILTPESQ
jgi:NAD(P)-dependent dehydrogenase (short-subunit alcohol dehydrogenase family)